MEYSKEFIQLIKNSLKEKEIHGTNEYIGFGNPNSKVLFVGKECSLNLENKEDNGKDKDDPMIYEKSNEPNLLHWEQNINDTSITPECIPVWKTTRVFNPLFPYKGDGLPIGNGTWNNYCKIISGLYPEMVSAKTPFHQFSFLTEFSDKVKKYSVHSDEVGKAIKRRCVNLFPEPFFRNFPIVIVGCGHYVRDYGINLQDVFDQKWEGPTRSVPETNEWINVHRNNNRILIHTRQLSMCSNNLIEEIVKLCRPYLK